ncbi:MAG: CHASE2 domain-containing protein [Chloroflexi bacterium]|nr:CHASE2 domain-containing protein [Chloroflexota bacterium]
MPAKEKKAPGKINLKGEKIKAVLLGIGCSFFVLILTFAMAWNWGAGSPFSQLDNLVYNYFYQSRFKFVQKDAAGEQYARISVINIDEKTLADPKVGKWPFPRERHAELIKKLDKAGAKTITIDILFQEASDPNDDKALADALNSSNNVILTCSFYKEGGELRLREPYPMLVSQWSDEKKLTHIGYTFELADQDGIVRRIPLMASLNDKLLYSLDLLAYSHLLNLPLENIQNHPEKGFLKIGDLKVPTYRNEMRISYLVSDEDVKKDEIGFTAGGMTNFYSFSDVLSMSDEDVKYYFKDKLVLIGVTAAAGEDIKNTPLGRMPGSIIHLNILLSMLEGNFTKMAGMEWNLLFILFMGFLPAFILPFIPPRIGLGVTIIFVIGAGVFALLNFLSSGSMLFITAPEVSLLLTAGVVTMYRIHVEEKAKQRFREIVEEFAPLPIPFIEEYAKGKSEDDLRKKVNLSVLFSDIRGYTTLSESMDPMEIAEMLHEYHGVMGHVFERNGGVVFTYIGDAQMVVFGLPGVKGWEPNHALAACRAGMEMQDDLAELNKKWEDAGRKTFAIGVGIASGEVSLGVVGGAQRKQYTVLGDTVNMAARLEGMSKTFGNPVNVNVNTYNACAEHLDAIAAEPIKIKGKTELQQIYRIMGVKEGAGESDKQEKKNP